MTVGKQIKHYRTQKGWVLERLGKEINFAKNTIHNWESDKRDPDSETIRRIAEALGVSIVRLFQKDGVLDMKESNGLHFIGSRDLDEMDSRTPKEVMDWLENFQAAKEEAGYPVILNDEYGYLAGMEYWHDEIEDIGGPTDDWKQKYPNVKCKELLLRLQETAKFLQVLEPNLQVFVGEKTAPLNAHEFNIFLPFGTSNETYNMINESWRYAEIKVAEEKNI